MKTGAKEIRRRLNSDRERVIGIILNLTKKRAFKTQRGIDAFFASILRLEVRSFQQVRLGFRDLSQERLQRLRKKLKGRAEFMELDLEVFLRPASTGQKEVNDEQET